MPSASFDHAALRFATVASSDGAVITQDLTGSITSWNRAAEQIFGHSATEALQPSITALVSKGGSHALVKELRRILLAECVAPKVTHGE